MYKFVKNLSFQWLGRHQAVCGSNGRLYKSLCSFQRAQCIDSQLRTAVLSTCTGEIHHRKTKAFHQKSKCRLARSQAQASARSDSFAIFIPECKSDRTYTEVQCHNQTGYCWCSSPDGMPMSGSSVLHLRPNCTGEFCLGAESTIRGVRWCSTPDPDQHFVLTAAGEFSVNDFILTLYLYFILLLNIYIYMPLMKWHYNIIVLNPEVTVPPFWVTILLNSDPNGNRSDRRPTDSLKTCEHERMSVLAEAAIQGSEEHFVPECSADGRYRAVQCHSSTGYSSFSSVQTLHRYFAWLHADTDGLLSEREILLRRTLRPRRCAKKLMQFCDRNADRRLSSQELTSCLGI
uniref:Thyroglobulin type-1 domain-containing protein n=1 Tax=Sinocyclocheilus grahami TaxID=75366 RepID=A0A672P9J9_SINGR